LDIRNQIIVKESKGVKVTMKTFAAEIRRNEAIEGAKNNIKLGMTPEFVVKFIALQLKISEDEAKEIFINEVQKSA